MATICEKSEEKYSTINMSVWLRSCKNEILQPIQGKSTGKLPKWLNGALIQNGGGLWEIGNTSFNHLFDCMALLHRYEIKNGEVTYQCRFLQSETYKSNIKANRIVVSDFGTTAVRDPCESVFSRMKSIFNEMPSDNAAVTVYPFGDELYCFTEFPIIYKIDKNTLETGPKRDFSNMGIVHHSSHPHVTKDGTVYTLATSTSISGIYHNIVCFPSQPHNKATNGNSMFEKARVVAYIPARWTMNPSYMHTFGITNNFFVIIEQPINLYIPKLMLNKVTNGPVISSLRCYKNELTKINVLSRFTGHLDYTFYAEDFFYFHVINSFEYDSHIVLDVCCIKDASMMECLYKDSLKNAHNDSNYADMIRSRPVRYILPLIHSFKNIKFRENLVKIKNSTAQAYLEPDGKVIVKPEPLCDISCDMPTINYNNYSGKVYKYFYAVGTEINIENTGVIVKVDTSSKTVKRWFEKDYYPTEPIFVPSPDAKDEDDGIVLSGLLHSSDDRRVAFIALDAKTFTEIGRTTFETPSSVPMPFHGCFIKP